MIDKTTIHAALDAAAKDLLAGKKARANIPYPGDSVPVGDFFKHVEPMVRAWAKTNGVDAHTGMGVECLSVALMGPIKASPLRATVRKPWHFMEIHEEKIVEGIPVNSLRAYVSMYSRHLDMAFSVNRLGPTTARLTRIF